MALLKPSASPAPWPCRAWLAAALVVAAVLRLLAARNELWLDEIWSLEMTRAVHSPLELLTLGHHDNNHLLNTWYLYWAGEGASPLVQRLLAVVSGVAVVGAAAWIARAGGWFEACLAATLCALSFPLVLYSSEARGYAPAGLFALLAFACQRAALRTGGLRACVGLWLCVALGFLAHPSFLHVYLALLAWSGLHAFADGGWRGLAHQHAVPLAVLGALYWITLRHMLVGGGPILAPLEVLRETLALASGAPQAEPWQGLTLVATLAGLSVGLACAWRRDRGEGAFVLLALSVAPALVVFVTRPELLYFRYFLVLVPFAYLLLAQALAALGRRGWLGRGGVAVVLALYAAGQGARIEPLLRDGRGQYGATLRFMAEATSDPLIEVGSDHDFRNLAVLEYHARRLGLAQRLRYVPEGQWPVRGPEWLLLHRGIQEEPPAAALVHNGRRYQLVYRAPCGAVSGWIWFLYRRPALRAAER